MLKNCRKQDQSMSKKHTFSLNYLQLSTKFYSWRNNTIKHVYYVEKVKKSSTAFKFNNLLLCK